MSDVGLNPEENEPAVEGAPPVLTLDEPAAEPPAPAPTNAPRRARRTENPTWEDVEAARKEERDKLFERLNKTEATAKELKEAADKAAKEAAAKAKAEAKAQADLEKKEMDAIQRIELMEREFQAKLEEERKAREMAEALFQKEQELSRLNAYMNSRVAELGDEIMPELREFIGGNSQEEIDASIDRAVTKTQQIMGQFQQAVGQYRSGQPTVRAGGQPPVEGVGSPAGQRQYTLDDLQNMSMEDYQAHKQELWAAARRGQ